MAIDSIRISYCVPFGDPNRPVLLSELCVESAGRSDLYQLPLGFLDESDFGTALPQQLALARVRRGPQVGLMTDAFALEQFSAAVIQGLRDELVLPCSDGEVRFVPMPQLDDLQLPEQPEVRFISAEQSNSSAIIDNKVMIKLLRRVAAGIHPELEMGGFLTARGFAHISGMLGQVSRINKQGEPVALMVIQHFLDSQGDAWVWTLNNLDRAVRDEIAGGVSMHENQFSALDELQAFNRLLGQRLGEMHMAWQRTPTMPHLPTKSPARRTSSSGRRASAPSSSRHCSGSTNTVPLSSAGMPPRWGSCSSAAISCSHK